MQIRTQLVVLFAFLTLAALSAPSVPRAEAAWLSDPIAPPSDLLQFTSGGHILGFQSTGVYVVGANRLLRVDFVGASGDSPVSAEGALGKRGAPFAEPVTYSNLWEGITASFQPVSGGLYKSTYLLSPGASVAEIRLRYSIPVDVDSSGALVLRLTTGEYRESAPVAWQEIEGTRVPVEVAYQPRTDSEIGFVLGPYDPAWTLVIDPTLQWTVFLGGSDYDIGKGIAVDGSGNIYVVGDSWSTWGEPKLAFYDGSANTFVAKLNSAGAVVWNTFLGEDGWDAGKGIALDGNGNIYITGDTTATWGSAPRLPYTYFDVYVAKLDNNGVFQWNTFLGSNMPEYSYSIAVDGNANVYVAGSSEGSWGSVVPEPYVALMDGFVAKLNTNGYLLWNSFLGGESYDQAYGVAVDHDGNVFLTGGSSSSWGSPLSGLHDSLGNPDAFVAKLNSAGDLQWNTFLGSSARDYGYDIKVEDSGNLYVIGYSDGTWGLSPRRAFSASDDVFAVKLDASGALLWNTFLGGTDPDEPNKAALDASGNLYITGYSFSTWGSPVRAFSGAAGTPDAQVSKLDNSGNLLWNTFLGNSYDDYGNDITVDRNGVVYVTGETTPPWSSSAVSPASIPPPDAFVAAIRKENATVTITDDTPDPSVVGQTVTISFTVAAESGSRFAPTGTVTVCDSTASCTASIGVGYCELVLTTAGIRNLTATFSGDGNYAVSSTNTTHEAKNAQLFLPIVRK